MASESASLFWWNWQSISRGGHAGYGTFVYRQMLPHFSPSKHRFPIAFYYFFDGDCLPASTIEIPYAGPSEAKVLQEVLAEGADRFYVVAVWNMGDEVSLAEVDRALREGDVLGYAGMTSLGEDATFEAFLALTGEMSLCHAFDIDCGTSFKKDSFSFLNDRELTDLGFEPSGAP